ncbi:MAG TPA: FAD-dependent oxidoreductase [Saprospiraceae bacterium]|nr:FAD-dependent oxidoreductase [Saprospiraceae bacterium]HMP23013.1 FAD-dependent oxidoreductase [Saprospiraceae bacterium]
MPWKWYESKVVKIADASPTTKRFWLETPLEEPINFIAGQFVTMDLPISDKRLKRWRSYSIANAPNDKNLLEFCIVHMEGGAATEYLFNEVQEGTTVKFKGPDGTFTLPEPVNKDLVFICTGTGVAPFRSMIQDLHEQGKPHRNIHLIFGTRYADGILYRAEFEALQQQMPGFRYSVALSREEPLHPADFPFEIVSGYVHQLYLMHYASARPDVDFYICGWSNMIDEAVANLLVTLQYDKSQIHYELYG